MIDVFSVKEKELAQWIWERIDYHFGFSISTWQERYDNDDDSIRPWLLTARDLLKKQEEEKFDDQMLAKCSDVTSAVISPLSDEGAGTINEVCERLAGLNRKLSVFHIIGKKNLTEERILFIQNVLESAIKDLRKVIKDEV